MSRSARPIAQSDGLIRSNTLPASGHTKSSTEEESLFEKRKKRHPKTPHDKKIPGLDISELTSEKLELLLSLNLDSHPLTKAWKIKAAHDLATRYIEGKNSQKKQKAPQDELKAYAYAEKEINTYSIEELEENFFQLDVNGTNTNIVKHWKTTSPVNAKLYNENKIDACIAQAKWNGLLREEKASNANAILVAWEKQLIAARLAAHYKKLKKERRDADSALTAKFYKRLVHHFAEHEPPAAKISIALKKISPRFNQIRLFLSRLSKIFSAINGALPLPLKLIFSIAGLYFLVPFLMDLTVVIQDPQAFWEDNRPSRMANDLVWFLLNLSCFTLTLFLTPVAPLLGPLLIGLLTVGGCIFDVGAEAAIGVYGYRNQQQMLDTIDVELNKLKHIDVNHHFTHREITKYPEDVALKKQYIAQKQSLLNTREQILKKRKELYINRAYTVAIMALLAIAAAFIFFPPAGITLMIAGIPAIPLIAACSALVGGSVFGGIGKHIFWNAIMDKEFHTACKEKFWQVCKWIKSLFVVKIKTPLENSKDDWSISYNTKQIRGNIENTEQPSPNKEPVITAIVQNNRITSHLHRLSSGILFVPEPPHRPNTCEQKIPPSQTSPGTSKRLGVSQI